tara:strand:+ start:40 stop:453 length:414 start_codon:yes stop_codon:yes gene_type:complete
MKNIDKDIEFGLTGEQYTKPFIEKSLGIIIEKTLDEYHSFDFVSEDRTTFIEVKTRNITYACAKYYKELFISTSKINYIKHNPTNTYYFCYNLHDAILLYKYSTSKLNTTINGRMDEGLKKLCLLPVKDMDCIHYKN